MMLMRVLLRQTWYAPGDKRYRAGEQYIPYDMARLLPMSATILPDDDHIRRHDTNRLIALLRANIDHWGKFPDDPYCVARLGRDRAELQSLMEIDNGREKEKEE